MQKIKTARYISQQWHKAFRFKLIRHGSIFELDATCSTPLTPCSSFFEGRRTVLRVAESGGGSATGFVHISSGTLLLCSMIDFNPLFSSVWSMLRSRLLKMPLVLRRGRSCFQRPSLHFTRLCCSSPAPFYGSGRVNILSFPHNRHSSTVVISWSCKWDKG
jgi:hypothetical protein